MSHVKQRSQVVTHTTKAATTSAQLLMPANKARLAGSIYNDSSAVLTLLLGTADQLTAGAVSLKVDAGGYYEVPGHYEGSISGLWASATGQAYVDEFV